MSTQTDKFTAAYIACALWSSSDQSDDSGGTPLDQLDAELAPETLEKIKADCADFQGNEEIAALLRESGLSDEQAGHDFWLTRNGHGAGFWDRGLGDIGRKLTDLTKPYGTVDLYVGDDGKIYC